MDLFDGGASILRATQVATLSGSPATNKMNNLYSVTLGQSRAGPLVAPNYLLIKLDGDPRGFEGQVFDEIVQHRSLSHLPALTIKLNQQLRGLFFRKVYQVE